MPPEPLFVPKSNQNRYSSLPDRDLARGWRYLRFFRFARPLSEWVSMVMTAAYPRQFRYIHLAKVPKRLRTGMAALW